MLRRTVALIGTLIVALGVFVAVDAGPAHAGNGAPPCGSKCDLKDPATYKIIPNSHDPSIYYYCATGAITAKYATAGTWRIQLRYSPTCETTWVRLINLGTGTPVPLRVEHVSTYLSGGVRKRVWDGFVSDWTVMLDDHDLLNYACIYTYANEWDFIDGIVQQKACTGKY